MDCVSIQVLFFSALKKKWRKNAICTLIASDLQAFVKTNRQWCRIFVKTIGKSIYALLLFVRL